MNNYYVYAYLRSKDSQYGSAGQPYYIGKGKGKRAFSKNHTTKPPTDLTKIVFIAEGLVEKDALQAEMLLIAQYGRIDLGTGCLRNHTDGGEGILKLSVVVRKSMSEKKLGNKFRLGKTHTCEAKQKMRIASTGKQYHLGYKHSVTTKQKMRENNLGKTTSAETKKKQALGMKERYENGYVNPQTGKVPWNKGLKATEEHKKKLSQARIGRTRKPHSEETKQKMRIAALKRN